MQLRANGTCGLFPQQIPNCTAYANDTGVCTACTTGLDLYLNTLQNLCLPVTTVVTNCKIYSSSTVCAQCKDSLYYLSGGACLLVPAAQLVPYCLQYSPSVLCTLCAATDNSSLPLYLNTVFNQCVRLAQASVANCSSYNSNMTCSMCVDNQVGPGWNLVLNANNTCAPIANTTTNCLQYYVNTTNQC